MSRRSALKAAAALFAGAAFAALPGCSAPTPNASGASSTAVSNSVTDQNAFYALTKVTRVYSSGEVGQEHTITNDSAGNPIKASTAKVGNDSGWYREMMWDTNGNPLSYNTYSNEGKVTGSEKFTTTTTDSAGRATTVQRGSSNTVTLTYDSNGYIASASRGKYTFTFSDGAATRLWYSQTSGDSLTFGNYQKDANGRYTGFTLDDGANSLKTYTIEYGADGTISKLIAPDGETRLFEWEKVDNPSPAVASKPPIYYVTTILYYGSPYMLYTCYDV